MPKRQEHTTRASTTPTQTPKGKIRITKKVHSSKGSGLKELSGKRGRGGQHD